MRISEIFVNIPVEMSRAERAAVSFMLNVVFFVVVDDLDFVSRIREWKCQVEKNVAKTDKLHIFFITHFGILLLLTSTICSL